LQAQQSNAHVSLSTSMTRPLPAPHAIAVSRRCQLPFQQFDNERSGRVGSDAKKCTRVTPIHPKGGAHKKSRCTYSLRSSKTTIVPIIAASVAKANAVLFSQSLMSPGPHNGQQYRPTGCAWSLWRVRRRGLFPQGRRADGYAHRGQGAVRHREGSENWPRFRLAGACKLART
jgi:hypothetical protein